MISAGSIAWLVYDVANVMSRVQISAGAYLFHNIYLTLKMLKYRVLLILLWHI